MKSIRISATGPRSVAYFRLFAVRAIMAACLGLASTTYAVTFTGSVAMPAFTTGATLLTQNQPTLGTFDFSTTPYASFGTVTSLTLTLALYDLQTMSTGNGNDKRDFNNISLTLGGSNTTTILLNGYARNAGSTVTTTGTPTNSAAIIQALATNNGMLTFGLWDITPTPSNSFDYFGGTAVLTLDVTQVPFSPSATLGLSVVAAIGLFRGWPRWRRRFAAART